MNLKFRISFFLFIVLTSCTGNSRDVLIEAESFEAGGWTNDWQFIEQMGSPYLMAIGYGEPVADAVRHVRIPDGKYRIWVRTKDWLPEYHPGTFELQVNGRTLPVVFGASGRKGWTWEDGGVHRLSGDCELRLRDLTGYYGRCDAILLSVDLDARPPDTVEALRALRIHHGIIGKETENRDYDVVVIGGGMAGCMAAVSAARQGVKVALVQNRYVLGGNASMEHMIPPVGTVKTLIKGYEKFDPRETGLIEEVSTHGPQQYFTAGKPYSVRLMHLVRAESDIDLFLGMYACEVEMSGNKIAKVGCVDISSGKHASFSGRIFIDCTGDGMIGIKAGAEHTRGREAKSAFNESKAPEIADSTILGSSLKYWFLKKDDVCKFETPAWAYQLKHPDDFPVGRLPRLVENDLIDHQWMIEHGGNSDTYHQAEEIRDELLQLIYGIWGFRKNHDTRESAAIDSVALVWVSHVLSTRESYRLLGDYVLNENDVTEQVIFPDRVAYGGWGLDDHPSAGFFQRDHYNNHSHGGVLHSIPFRSLYSRNIDNLLMAGRNISASHVALTGTRVMLTTSVIGQAAGTAAALCTRHHHTPRTLYREHIADLQQQLLKDGAYLIEMKNEDPADLALKAKASASSELSPASEAINGYGRARLHTAFKDATFRMNAWMPDRNRDETPWLQLEWDTPQTFNVVHVNFQSKELTPASFEIQAFADGEWRSLQKTDNRMKNRRNILVTPASGILKIRILLTDNACTGGISELRVYQEDEQGLAVARRINQANLNDGDIKFPWEI